MRVTVYCGSSDAAPAAYLEAGERLGRSLARAGATIVYGGGNTGSMGALADGAIAEGGRVLGVAPRFMAGLEWVHGGLAELVLVDDLHERKRRMIQDADACVALPGATGTLEELFEAITWKRLGLANPAIVLLDVDGFFAPVVALLERCITERLLDPRHRDMWTIVSEPEDVLGAIRAAPPWDADAARTFATFVDPKRRGRP